MPPTVLPPTANVNNKLTIEAVAAWDSAPNPQVTLTRRGGDGYWAAQYRELSEDPNHSSYNIKFNVRTQMPAQHLCTFLHQLSSILATKTALRTLRIAFDFSRRPGNRAQLMADADNFTSAVLDIFTAYNIQADTVTCVIIPALSTVHNRQTLARARRVMRR